MAEQQQTSPEAVEALAKVLWLADNQGADPDWLEMAWADMGGSEASDERARHEIHAAALLADPGPLLAALAEAGVLEVEEDFEWCDDRCSIRDHYGEECGHQCRQAADHGPEHKCVNGHTYPRARHHDDPIPRQHRLVSPWKPTDPEEAP